MSQSAAPANIPQKSIAVLPFRNLSEDKDNAFFSDGIQEELLNLLSKVPQLQVAARTSSFSFKGKQVEIPEIARQLHVANVLEGSVRKSGDQLRITAQLIRAAEGYHLWSETYDRKLDDIFKIQDEIAGEVVKQLKVTLLGAAPKVRTDRSEGLRALPAGGAAWAAEYPRGVYAVRCTLPAGARDRSALCPGVARAGEELHQRGKHRAAAEQEGYRSCPRGGGEGVGDRSRLRAGACRASAGSRCVKQ